MKQAPAPSENIFNGTWRITRVCTKILDREIMSDDLSGSECVLKFTPGNRWELSSGELIFEGVIGNLMGRNTSYVYVPSCSLLRIGRPINLMRHTTSASITFHYRVTPFSETEYWLYDLAGADKDTGDYKVKFKIEKRND